ncbi:hypothetical protein P3X46_018928 [Hevea brasiliensis]|uniref:Seed biotin-containing protein SBP65 n=1 Tax=Hevea brasiliensis TaxID=3981 RepID=A0ABQ9LS85_HEVBR|nr:hypothetical protein P3X46_018928 [Hevea brasiliensis]
MESEKAPRENTTNDREVHLEDPKTTKDSVGAADRTGKARETNEGEAQFESLVDKMKGIDTSRDKDEAREQEKGKVSGTGGGGKSAGAYSVGKFEVDDEEERVSTEAEKAGKEENGENKQLSLEEISKLRQFAQQNSALKGARERYEKAKEKTSQGLGAAAEYAKEKGAQTKDSVLEGTQRTSQQIAEKGAQAKDTVLEGAGKTTQYAAEKGSQAKDSLVEGAQKTSQQMVEKGFRAKDTVLEGAQKITQYVAEKGSQAKDTVVEGAQKTSQYAKGKAAAAKEATGERITPRKKTVEGTKAAARAVQGVTEKAAELASKPFSVAKQAATSIGESMEYFQDGDYTEESQVRSTGREGGEQEAEPTESISKKVYPEASEEEQQEHHQWQQQRGRSLLGAISETIAEIAQTTKELLIGPSQPIAQDYAGYEANQTQYSKEEEHKSRG